MSRSTKNDEAAPQALVAASRISHQRAAVRTSGLLPVIESVVRHHSWRR